ncbi:glycosyltransferase family 2 protein [Lapillicoccus jejuensis]|uniref:Dolichol-phosphate mannosyltransferase n=1 Tax=Lapillicoccus jejuensis TaxID=402171 RepID=A0A542DVE1_9MICO|nr:glycosyltransferase family 2 protein [Lapillicoccus jejuensis]TQJ07062.1 dolichol-phosphate mannosyltransferase [Lapillicoccus jejuensis]
MNPDTDPELSVVIPMYNEEEVLPLLVDRLRPTLEATGATYEVVAVDDGSTDLTPALLQRMHRDWDAVRVVRLRANAGHQAAISAGLVSARGDYVVTIDADLQDPPEVIGEMLSLARTDGLDVVYGVRNDRSTDTVFKRVTARAFYSLIRRMSGTSAQSDAGDFRLMSRATVDAINELPEHNRVLRFIVPALGFPSGTVEYRREERAAGVSKYPLLKMLKLSVDSLTGFSMAPLRLATLLGIGGGVLAVLLGIFAVVESVMGKVVAGWTSTVVIVAAVGAAQLLCLGLLGEYIGRMYTQMQGRPTYFIAYDSLAAPARRGPTDTPLPPRGAPTAGRRGPVARTPDEREVPPADPVLEPADPVLEPAVRDAAGR